jgi:DGQHR domain-containing protein
MEGHEMSGQLNLVDPDVINLEIDCLKATQPIGDVFIASVPFNVITKIAHFDVRRVIQDSRDVERYLGIQRPLEPKRVHALEEYVNYYDASFPTSIIIAIDEKYASYDEGRRKLIVSNTARDEGVPSIPIHNLARVIDGQHRIAGLFKFQGQQFDVPVSIFIGADIADQAHIFSTVNLEQTKVNKSLVYDLYSLAKSRSPQKSCHVVAVALDQDKDGPLYQRIKRLGTTTIEGKFEPLSQAVFVEVLMKMISAEPKRDRDLILKGKPLGRVEDDDQWRYPFRQWFIDGKDALIAQAVHRYFSAVQDVWPVAWENKERNGLILNRTNGFRSLMRVYPHLNRQQNLPGATLSYESAKTHFLALGIRDADFSIANFPPGSSGESRLTKVFSRDVTIEDIRKGLVE